MSGRATSGKSKQRIARVFPLALLVFYIIGSSQVETFHFFVHGYEKAVTHHDEQEQNPCHRLIYHDDTGEGCAHESHLVVSGHCEMCDLACQGDQVWVIDIDDRNSEFESAFYSFYREDLDNYRAVISSSRAPPMVI